MFIPFHLKAALLWRFDVAGNNTTYVGLHVTCQIFLFSLNQISIRVDFHRSLQYEISWKSIRWEPIDTCGQRHGQTWRLSRRMQARLKRRIERRNVEIKWKKGKTERIDRTKGSNKKKKKRKEKRLKY